MLRLLLAFPLLLPLATALSAKAQVQSPDGSSISYSSGGSLITASGTWSFGTGPDQYGDYQLLLNGVEIGIGLEMEVANGGQIYMADEPGPSDWWLWQNGAWSPSSEPNGNGNGNGAYEPPGCQPGNHGAVRGRPSIKNIDGQPVLAADDGCLIVSYNGWANSSGFGPGGVYENPSPYASDVYSSATFGVNLQWMQEVDALGFNAVTTAVAIIDPADESTCNSGYPFAQTLGQFVSSTQTLLSYANQTGQYLIIGVGVCGDWNGGSIDPAFQTRVWATLAQDFGSNTNVIFADTSEPFGFSNYSCGIDAQINYSDYQTLQQYAPGAMFLAWGDAGPASIGSCGPGGPPLNYSTSAVYGWDSISWQPPIAQAQSWITNTLAPQGVAAFSLEGPESPDNCAFGASGDTALPWIQGLMSVNTGWQCDDGWPNPYGPVVPFWPQD